jgi:uncharacterized protein (DUF58 family)
MPIPTRRLALLCAIASVAMIGLGNWAGFFGVNLALVLLVAVDVAFTPSPAKVEIDREVPEIVALDAVGEIMWRVTNPTRRRLVVDFADELAPSLRARTRRAKVALPAGRTAEVRTKFRPARRGKFEIRDMVVRVEGPLGLAALQKERHRTTTLRVYPPFRSKEEAELRIRKAQILEIGLRTAQSRGGGTEFDQLREYTNDDEFKRIDWAATARAGKAIVRTYRAERNQTVISLLDNGRVMAARVDDVPRVEHAMDAVMMITAVSTRLGDRAGLVAFDNEVRSVVPPGHGRNQLSRVTESMYALEPQLAESDYLGAFAETLARFRRRAMLIIYTDLVEQAVHETLLPALPLIARSHLVVVATVQDPAVVRWAVHSPLDEEEAYRKASAISALDERRRITARLRGMGATVVDAPPGLLAPQLADAYLKVKATGRL